MTVLFVVKSSDCVYLCSDSVAMVGDKVIHLEEGSKVNSYSNRHSGKFMAGAAGDSDKMQDFFKACRNIKGKLGEAYIRDKLLETCTPQGDFEGLIVSANNLFYVDSNLSVSRLDWDNLEFFAIGSGERFACGAYMATQDRHDMFNVPKHERVVSVALQIESQTVFADFGGKIYIHTLEIDG